MPTSKNSSSSPRNRAPRASKASALSSVSPIASAQFKQLLKNVEQLKNRIEKEAKARTVASTVIAEAREARAALMGQMKTLRGEGRRLAKDLKRALGDADKREAAHREEFEKIAELRAELAHRTEELKRKSEELAKLANDSAGRRIFHKILCPVDFDDNAMAALKIACKVAIQNDASLCVMHVVAMPAQSTEMPPEALKPYPIWEREAKLKLDQIARERIPGLIRSETVTRSGLPAPEITATAKDLDVDLIVMATYGHSRSAVEHLFLGSVAEHVVRNSVCVVMVVPPMDDGTDPASIDASSL